MKVCKKLLSLFLALLLLAGTILPAGVSAAVMADTAESLAAFSTLNGDASYSEEAKDLDKEEEPPLEAKGMDETEDIWLEGENLNETEDLPLETEDPDETVNLWLEVEGLVKALNEAENLWPESQVLLSETEDLWLEVIVNKNTYFPFEPLIENHDFEVVGHSGDNAVWLWSNTDYYLEDEWLYYELGLLEEGIHTIVVYGLGDWEGLSASFEVRVVPLMVGFDISRYQYTVGETLDPDTIQIWYEIEDEPPHILTLGEDYTIVDLEYYTQTGFEDYGTLWLRVLGLGRYQSIGVDFYIEVAPAEVDMESIFPDKGLRRAVYDAIDVEYGGVVFQNQLDVLTTLDASYRGITDVTGLSHIPIQNLNLDGNELETFSFEGLSQLQVLSINDNQLTSLDFTYGTVTLTPRNLKEVYCQNNQLASLLIANRTGLEILDCSNNVLEHLDLSGNADLTYLDVTENLLKELDLTNNSGLSRLYASNNYLLNQSYIMGLDAMSLNAFEFYPQYVSISVSGSPYMTSRGTRSISFAWEEAVDGAGIDCYIIYRDGVEIGSSTLESYTDTGLLPGHVYSYSIVAISNSGQSSDESESTVMETAVISVVDYANFEGSYHQGTAAARAVHIDVETLEGYIPYDADVTLQYRLDGTEEWRSASLPFTSFPNANCRFSGLLDLSDLPAGTYEARYSVIDADGTQAFFGEQSFEILPDVTAPTVTMPSFGSGQIFGGNSLVSIYVVADDDLAMDRIEMSYSTDGGDTFTVFGTYSAEYLVTRLTHTFQLDHSEISEGYVVIKATAWDRAGNSAFTASTVYFDKTPPDTPQNFSVTSTNQYIHLDWSYADVPSDFYRFHIYRGNPEEGEFALHESIGTIGYYDDVTKGVEMGGTYYYYITAVDTWGNESPATAVLSGALEEDTEPPALHSYAPAPRSQLQKSVEFIASATDNYMLSYLEISYRVAGSEDWDWKPIVILSADRNAKSQVFRYTWDCSKVEEGDYEVRLTVIDAAGNESRPEIIPYKILAYSPPKPPEVTADGGHKRIDLSWSYSGDKELLHSYKIYRSTEEAAGYQLIMTLGANQTSYSDTVENDVTYFYKVTAVDRYKETADSAPCKAVAIEDDDIDPIAVIMPEELAAVVDQPFTFSGALSTDNDAIASYRWDFGDGETGSGVMPTHIYREAGDFTVTLTVIDESGNTGSAQAVINVQEAEEGNTLLTLRVVNASLADTPAIEGATVYLSPRGNGGDIMAASGQDGTAAVQLAAGTYTVSVIKDGYLPRTFDLTVSGEPMERIVGLSTTSLVTGEITSTPMDQDEIIEAGIDVNDPDNEHVTKFEVEFEFKIDGERTITLDTTYYTNSVGTFITSAGGMGYGGGWWGNGELIPAGGSDSGGSTSGGGSGGVNVAVYPLSETFFLVVYGEAHWLKEMYNVQLVVINNSYTDSIDNCRAVIDLPSGLSLASMVDGAQSREVLLGTIETADTDKHMAAANWYVRGDAEGEYYIDATVTGTNMPHGEHLSLNFTTTDAIKVYAGNALELNIYANSAAYQGEDYHVLFELKNTSTVTLHNLSFGITGASQYQVATAQGFESENLWTDEDLGGSASVSIGALNPGGSILIDFSTTTLFETVSDQGPIDAEYLLKNIFVTFLEGSTTEIPVNIYIDTDQDSAAKVAVYEITNGESGGDVYVIYRDANLQADLEAGGTRRYRIKNLETDRPPSPVTVRLENGSTGADGVIRLSSSSSDYTVNNDGSITITGDAVLTVEAIRTGDAKITILYNESDSYRVNYTVTGETPQLTGVVRIDGEPRYGEILTVDTDDLTSDLQVELLGLSYQWKRDGNLISGAADSFYMLTADDIGTSITVTVTAENCKGSVTSDATAQIDKGDQNPPAMPSLESRTATSITLEAIEGAEYRIGMYGTWQDDPTFTELLPNADYNFYARMKETDTHDASPASSPLTTSTEKAELTGSVTIDGEAAFNETLEANTDNLTSEPETETGVLYYQWKRGDEEIPGATGHLYRLVAEDIGKVIAVTVTAAYCTGEVTSGATSEVEKADGPDAPEKPTLEKKDSISAALNAIEGAEYRLSAYIVPEGANPEDGRWADGQWQNSAVFTELTPNSKYRFYARIKETDTHKASEESPALDVETDKANLVGGVIIRGEMKYGETLTAVTEALFSEPDVELGEFSYQWERNGRNIPGAKQGTYTLTVSDIGSMITVTVTAENCAGEVTSKPTTEVLKADGPAAPTVTGSYTGDGSYFSYTINSVARAEYSAYGIDWQDSSTFAGFSAGDTVTFYARAKESDTHEAGDPGSIDVTFVKLSEPATPELEYTVSSDRTTITITPVNGAEYKFGDDAWESENSKSGYSGTETVTIQIRYAETATHDAGSAATADVTISGQGNSGNGGSGGGSGGSSSSGSSDGTTKIRVSAGDGQNGTVTVDNTSPAAGDTVTFTVTPDDGYAVLSVTVTDKNGTVLACTEGDDSTYSFRYTGIGVTITAAFVRNESGTPLNYGVPAYNDITEDDWFYDAVLFTWQNGILTGTSATTFEPETSLTRGMLVTMLWRLAGEPAAEGGSPFTDVPSGQWYSDAVAWADAGSIASGCGNGIFGPDDSITREQMALMLYNYCQHNSITLPTANTSGGFTDRTTISDWAFEAVETMHEAGILNGKGNGAFDPQGPAARAEAAQMFTSFVKASN